MSNIENNDVEFSGSIQFIPPENLLLLEVFHLNSWVPLTVGRGVVVCVPNKESAEKVIIQFKQLHFANKRKCPQIRYRPLTKTEAIDFRAHLKRYGEDSNWGTNVFNQHKIIKKGEIYSPNINIHKILPKT